MSAARAALSLSAPESADLARLKAKVDLPALIARGWDPESRVFAPPADDPLFGYHACERERCPRAGASDRERALGLCEPCTKRFFELTLREGQAI